MGEERRGEDRRGENRAEQNRTERGTQQTEENRRKEDKKTEREKLLLPEKEISRQAVSTILHLRKVAQFMIDSCLKKENLKRRREGRKQRQQSSVISASSHSQSRFLLFRMSGSVIVDAATRC